MSWFVEDFHPSIYLFSTFISISLITLMNGSYILGNGGYGGYGGYGNKQLLDELRFSRCLIKYLV